MTSIFPVLSLTSYIAVHVVQCQFKIVDQFSCNQVGEILTRTARVGSIESPCYGGLTGSYPGNLARWTKIINVTHTCQKLEGYELAIRDFQLAESDFLYMGLKVADILRPSLLNLTYVDASSKIRDNLLIRRRKDGSIALSSPHTKPSTYFLKDYESVIMAFYTANTTVGGRGFVIDYTAVCGNTFLDIVFVLDLSETKIEPNEFNAMKRWVIDMARRFDIDNGTAQIGVITYSSTYTGRGMSDRADISTHLSLGQYRSQATLLNAINGITHSGNGGQSTAAAIRKAVADFQSSSRWGSSSTENIMIVVTNGRTRNHRELTKAANAARLQDTTIYAIGVGKYDILDLRAVATGNLSSDVRVYGLSKYADLRGIVKDLSSDILPFNDDKGIDACIDSPTDPCVDTGRCIRTGTNFKCECFDGYYGGDDGPCTDEDECTSGLNYCHFDAICSNTIGAYECHCKSGHVGDGVACVATGLTEGEIGSIILSSMLGVALVVLVVFITSYCVKKRASRTEESNSQPFNLDPVI